MSNGLGTFMAGLAAGLFYSTPEGKKIAADLAEKAKAFIKETAGGEDGQQKNSNDPS